MRGRGRKCHKVFHGRSGSNWDGGYGYLDEAGYSERIRCTCIHAAPVFWEGDASFPNAREVELGREGKEEVSISDASEMDLGRKGNEEVMHVYFGSMVLWNDDTLFYVCS